MLFAKFPGFSETEKVKEVQWNQLLGSNSNFCFPLKPRMAFEWRKGIFSFCLQQMTTKTVPHDL